MSWPWLLHHWRQNQVLSIGGRFKYDDLEKKGCEQHTTWLDNLEYQSSTDDE